jgi:hypothetical protein
MENVKRMNLLRKVLLVWVFCQPAFLFAQEAASLPPVSRTYAITNVNIIQAPGRKIDMGTVVVKDGLIVSVGKNISIPANAIVIKADSMYVYAGFIDGLSRTGITKPKEEQGQQQRPKDPGNPKPEEAGITPYQDVRSSLNANDKSIEELRNIGFTTAQVVPYGGMMPGNGAVVLLGGKSVDDMILSSKASFYSELTPAQRVYPATVMGVMAKYRELYRQASLNRSYENMYASNRAGIQRPTTDRVLESFYPVIDKKQPVLFKAEKVMDAQRVLTLQSDLGFPLMLAELKEGWDIINKVKAANAKVFLSLDLPEEKKEEKKEDKKGDAVKEEAEKKQDKPKTAADVEKEALEKRKAEFIEKYVSQAALYNKSGVKFGFSTMSAKPSNIPANLRRMIKSGLSEDAALAALTTAPAELLGLLDRMGTVDNGKIANLIISDKPYFNEKAKLRYVFVDGNIYKLEVKEAKKADGNAKAEASGEWKTSIESPQGTYENNLSIQKNGSSHTGTVSGGIVTSPTKLDEVVVDGKSLSYKYSINFSGTPITIVVDATIEGDTFKGTASVSQFGSFPIEGKKSPNQ